jgi:hypothetical protein
MNPSDFVQVQLSPAGIALSESTSVRISNAHFNYCFTPGQPVKVLKFWPWLRSRIQRLPRSPLPRRDVSSLPLQATPMRHSLRP